MVYLLREIWYNYKCEGDYGQRQYPDLQAEQVRC